MPKGRPRKPRAKAVDAALLERARAIRARLAAGEDVPPADIAFLDTINERSGPRATKPAADDDSGPADVVCMTQKQLAAAAGLHENTVHNWKKSGVADPGAAPPFSLRAYFLLLRRRGKLGEAKPTAADARELLAWCWSGGGEAAWNPDDPTHAPPGDWAGEGERQRALRELTVRRAEGIKLETLTRERLPADLVEKRLRGLAAEVKGVLSGFLKVANLPGLAPEQRAKLSEAIQAQIAEAQRKLAEIR